MTLVIKLDCHDITPVMTMCHDSEHCHGHIKAFKARQNNTNNNDKQMSISKSISLFLTSP